MDLVTIEEIVSEKVEGKKSLQQIYDYIENKCDKKLSATDKSQIAPIYIKCCTELWLKETAAELLKTLTAQRDHAFIREILSSLHTLRTLNNVSNPFNQLECHGLLLRHHHLLSENEKKTILSRFKKDCLEQISACNNSAQKEFVFLEVFINFLSYTLNLQSIIDTFELKVFCNGGLSPKNSLRIDLPHLINNIMKLPANVHDEKLTALQEACEELSGMEDFLLADKFREIVSSYIKPIEIQEKQIDDRLVVEVLGTNVVVSEILQRLEGRLLQNQSIEEIRFIATEILHIDKNLGNDVWHRKNVVIYTKSIKIHGSVRWDVSGKDDNRSYSSNAGTGEDGHGNHGKDGYPGESGGNVLVLTEKIENPENFTIISNGGKGSKGQDGGNGRAGKDGVGISKAEFAKQFPVLCRLACLRSTRIKLVKKYYDNIAKNAKWMDSKMQISEHIFVEAETHQGNEITFYYGPSKGGKNAFLLYKGSLGQSGGYGGEYGIGGQGGFSGEIVIKNLDKSVYDFNITKNIIQGEDAVNGKGGLYGINGKNGWDMSYVDYQWWSERIECPNENSKCTIEFCNRNPSDGVWCEYKRKYARINITDNAHKNLKTYEERKNTRVNSNRQHYPKAARNRNISQNRILDNYSTYLNSIDTSILENLKFDLEQAKLQALQAINENQEQQEIHTEELRIRRHFAHQKKRKCHRNTTINTNSRESPDIRSLIDDLEKHPLLLDNWFKFTSIELDFSQLDRLLPILKILGDNIEFQSIKHIFKDKYRFATLQKIAKLPLEPEVTETGTQNITKFLIEAKETNNNISHPVLGTLNQYIFENNKQQQDKITKFCQVEVQDNNENRKILKRPLEVFILEVGESKEHIKKYYNERLEFLEKQKHNLNLFFDAFVSELSQPRHAEDVSDLTIQSLIDKSLEDHLMEKIEKDDFLNALYNRFQIQLDQTYDLNECCKDQAVLKEYDNYIRENGLLSESYRELLACVFSINIRIYIEDEEQKLHLQDNHNASSRKTLHILYRANASIIQLKVNENHQRLAEERKKKAEINASDLAIIMEPEINQIDEEIICAIIEYFPEEEVRQQLKNRLTKITSDSICQQSDILPNILKHFKTEGRHVSSNELFYFINSILTHLVEDNEDLSIYSWIIAAYPQRNWIDELVLLQLENYFKQPLAELYQWRHYLSKIENKNIVLLFGVQLDQNLSITIQCVEEILYLFNNISNIEVSLDGLELSEWPYALKEKYWICRLLNILNCSNNEDLAKCSYYLLAVENIFGTVLAHQFLQAIADKKQKPSIYRLNNVLSRFYDEKWSLGQDELSILGKCNFEQWVQKMHQKFNADDKERDITKLVQLIQGNANTSKEIVNGLTEIEQCIKCICIDLNYAIDGKIVEKFNENDIKNWVQKFQKKRKMQLIEETRKEMLAVIERAIMLMKKLRLRDTQKLTVLALLTNPRSALAQVSTGEGKSLIVVTASIMKALCGEKVDIITSSSVLARRDAEDNRNVYQLFSINVAHNCIEDIEKRKDAYSSNQVVYGDLSNFQRDYLIDKFYGKNILGGRKFENVIVDEVDSMLLDKGNNMLYLSHDLAGLDMLESVYIYIWQWLNRPANDKEAIANAFDSVAIKEAILNDLYGLMKKEDIAKLGSELSEQKRNTIWERMITANVIDCRGKLLTQNINENTINEILSSELACYKVRLSYLLRERIDREKYIKVPNKLKPFIEEHLECWITNAKTAFFMKEKQDYVVDVDRSGSSQDLNPNITILDRDTGTDQANSQWSEALHQFLQLKHGCKISLQSLKSVFISNVTFFKLYRHLYGLTGTLGSQSERDLLQRIHQVDFISVPTAKSKKFREIEPELCANKDQWTNSICAKVKKLIDIEKRSVLIICETVNDAEILYKAFGGTAAEHVHTYFRDHEQFAIADGLKQGQIIIATNLAGRGTDIKITQALREAGGLHVCLTYLPSNVRIEQQAFGRAARSGDEGSGQLIIIGPKAHGYGSSKVLNLKKQRDTEELQRLSDINVHYETQIILEENCFQTFREQYEQLNKKLDDDAANIPIKVKEILLQSCLDEWALWLDANGKYIENAKDEQSKRNLNILLNRFIAKLKKLQTKCTQNLHAWVEDNPAQMIKLGKFISEQENPTLMPNEKKADKLQHAIQLFDMVIEKEPYFSELAHYYKAFALTKIDDWKENRLEEVKRELRLAARLFDERIQFAITASGIIAKIKKNNDENIIKINAYEEQQKALANIYNMFSQSIDDIFGHVITPQSFVNADVTQELAEVLYEQMLSAGILKRPTIQKSINIKEELKLISYGYGIPVKKLNDFISNNENKEFDEKPFRKALKQHIKLPGREEFWKVLIQETVLTEEVKYVMFDDVKLKEANRLLSQFLADKINQNELVQQTLQVNDGEEILLHSEWVTPARSNDSIFKKDDFIRIVGKDTYKWLKEKCILSFNKKAHIEPSKIESITFPCHDSISLNDFIAVDITIGDAEKILAELVKRNVIVEKNNSEYQLKIKYDEIAEIQLPFCPVYENAVKELLSTCFAYRVAIQRIAADLLQENEAIKIRIHLMGKPHQSLVLELVQQKVISLPTLNIDDDEKLEEKIDSIFGRKMNKDDFKRCMLVQDGWNPEKCSEELFNFLLQKNWIVKCVMRDLYYINSFAIKNIFSILSKSRSSLIHQPKASSSRGDLKPIHDELAYTQEMYILSLSGLDKLLQFKDVISWLKKLLKTSLIIGLGLVQISIGTVIELYSVGVMTHVGSMFLSEGVSDIMFACSTLGQYSGKDYRKHKIESMLMSAVNCGVAAFFSRGTKLSRFGYKLAGPTFEIGGKKLAETAGTRLIDAVGWKVIRHEVIKSITSKATESIAFGLSYATVEKYADSVLQQQCENIGANFLSNIEQKIEKHNISANIKKLYETLGEKKASEELNNLTQKHMTEKDFTQQLLPFAKELAGSIVSEALAKNSKAKRILKYVDKWLPYFNHGAQAITDLILITAKFLDGLNKKIKKSIKNARPNDRPIQAEQNYESFKVEFINQWKSMIREKAGQVISEHILRPCLKLAVEYANKKLAKKLQDIHKSCKENSYCEQFKELKENYEEELCCASAEQQLDDSNSSQTERQITEKYHKDLLSLMAKTKSPKLFADMVRENTPMDMRCVDACTKVLHKELEEQGIKELTVIVEGEDGIRQTFCSGTAATSEAESLTILLQLRDNHFQFHANRMSLRNSNNCLYDAVSEQIELNMSAEDFRAKIATSIEKDPDIYKYIEKGRHKLPISLGVFGGKRARDINLSSSEINKSISERKIKFTQSSISGKTRDRKTTIDKLSKNISSGWKGPPIKGVRERNGSFSVLDHRRTIVSALSKSQSIPSALYDADNEFWRKNRRQNT